MPACNSLYTRPHLAHPDLNDFIEQKVRRVFALWQKP